MHFKEKVSNGVYLVPIETQLLADRTIFIEGEINQKSACDFAKYVMVLSRQNSQKPIDVLINSEGGEISSGLLIYDIIQTSTIPIRLFCLSKAYSMAALIFASGTYGRYMLPNSTLMLHEPLLGNLVAGSSTSLKLISDKLIAIKEKINSLLAMHTGRSPEEIDEITRSDHYFSADESVSFGLADAVITFAELQAKEVKPYE